MDIRNILNAITELEAEVNTNSDISGEPAQLNEYDTPTLFKQNPITKNRTVTKNIPRHSREYQRKLPQLGGLPKNNPMVAGTAKDFDDKQFQTFMRKFAKASQYNRSMEMLKLMGDLVAVGDEKEELNTYLNLPHDIGGGRWNHIHMQLFDKFYPRVRDLYQKYAARYKAKRPKSTIPSEMPRYFDNIKKPWAFESYIQEYENILNEVITSTDRQ